MGEYTTTQNESNVLKKILNFNKNVGQMTLLQTVKTSGWKEGSLSILILFVPKL